MDTALRPCSAPPRRAARRQLDAAGDDARGQREQAPVQLAQPEAEERIDGETARAGERHAEASEPEQQRVLVAALHQEEALFQVRADARDHVGYRNDAAFNRAFKRREGKGPGAYRRANSRLRRT